MGERPPAGQGPTLAVKVALSMIIVITVLSLVGMWVAQQLIVTRFAETESELVLRNRAVLRRVVDNEIAHLRSITIDWSQWDDLHAYVLGKNPAFADAELGSRVLDRLSLDIVVLLDADGRVVNADMRPQSASIGHEMLRSILMALPPRANSLPEVFPDGESGGAQAGLLDTSAGPFAISAHPILRTDASGPHAGMLVMGRWLHVAEVFGELSVIPATVALHPITGSDITPELRATVARLIRDGEFGALVEGHGILSDFQLLRDLNGEPIYVLESRMQREIVAAGRETTQLLLSGILAAAVLLIMIVILVIRRIVVDPLARLSRHMLALRESGGVGSTPGLDATDEIGRLARCFEDLIRQRHEDQQHLEQFAEALKHAGDAISILDRQGRIVYVNSRYEYQTGYKLADVEGTVPGYRVESGEAYERLWATVNDGRVWSGKLHATHRDGTPLEEEVTVAPICTPDGRVISFVSVMRDITSQQRTEAELRRMATVVEHAADAIVVLDANGRIEYVNPAFEVSRGLRRDEVVGRALREVFRGCDGPEYYEQMRAVVRRGDVWSGRIQTESANGETLIESAVVSPIVQHNGTHASYAIILHDLTRREQLEKQLVEARRLEAVGRLAAGVAHEINTPTQYLGDNIRFLQEAFVDIEDILEELARLSRQESDVVDRAVISALVREGDVSYLRVEIPAAIRQSLEGVARVTEIVRSMKELSHPARNLEPVDLNQVVQNAIAMTASEWKPVAFLNAELDPALPFVHCQAIGISQVVVNMLVNAAHAIRGQRDGGEEPRGTISVHTRRSDDQVQIVIADDGPGMTDDVRERIFDPFYTTKPVGQGTGQGLTIARNIVQNHGGGIRVVTAPGRGTSFTIDLPLKRPAAFRRTEAAA